MVNRVFIRLFSTSEIWIEVKDQQGKIGNENTYFKKKVVDIQNIFFQVVVAILWLSSLTIMGTLVFSSVHLQKFDRVVTHAEDTTYLAFSKTVWALCVCWIITACAHGYGGNFEFFIACESII